MRGLPGVRVSGLAMVAGGLLVVALLLQLAYVQPRLEEVRRLGAQRAGLSRQAGELDRVALEAHFLTRRLQVKDLREVLSDRHNPDPVAYVGGLLERSGLRRLELSTGSGEADSSFQRVQSTVRVMGTYSQVLDFVRALEDGAPLSSVDALSLEAVQNERMLEARFGITVYRPRMERMP